MATLVIEIPAQEVRFDLEDYREDFYDEEEYGGWDWDGLYDTFIYEGLSGANYYARIVD